MANATTPYLASPGNTSGSPSMPSVISQSNNAMNQILQTLTAIDRKMDSIVAKAQAFSGHMGSGIGGTGMGGAMGTSMVMSNGMPMPTIGSGNTLLGNLSQSTTGGGVSGGTRGGGSQPAYSMKVRFGGIAVDAAAAMGFAGLQAAGTEVQQAYGNSVMFQRLGAVSGTGAPGNNGQATFKALQSGFSGGYVSTSDMLDATNQMYNMGWGGQAMQTSMQHSMSSFAQMTNNTLSNTSQMMGKLVSNPQSLMQARAFGITPLTRSGAAQAPQQTISQILRATWGGRTPSKSAVDSALSPYGNLRQNFQNMGMSDEEIGSLQPSIEAWATSGGGTYSSSNAAIKDSSGNTLLKTGRARAAAGTAVSAGEWGGLTDGVNAANVAAEKASQTMLKLGSVLTALGAIKGFSAGTGTNADGTASVIGHAASSLGKLALEGLGLRSGGKAIAGRIFGGTGAAGSGAADAGAMELGGGALLAGAGTAAAGFIGGHLADKAGAATGHSTTGRVVGDALRGAAVGATIGSVVPVLGTGVGAAVGSTLGAGWAFHKSIMSGLGLGASTGKSAATTAPARANTTGGSIAKLLQVAQSQIGVPYAWGGGGTNGPSTGTSQGSGTVGFDCSGFTQYCFAQIGIQLPRTTWDQIKMGQPVAPADALPGDLVFFEAGGHVGIYMGNNKFINAPHTGTSVQIEACDPKSCFAIRRVAKGGAGGGATSAGASAASAGSGGAVAAMLEASMGSAMSGANVLGMSSGGSLGLLSATSTGGTSNPAGGSGGSSSAGPSGKGGTYSYSQMVSLAQGAGFSPANARIMGAIGMAESSGASTDHNTVAPDDSYGLWQINMIGNMGPGRRREFGISNNTQLFDPTTNAHAAHDVYDSQGFGAWSTYNNNAYRRFLPSHDKGAWNIPSDEIAQIHEGEMVVPKHIAKVVRKAVKGGAPGGGTVTIQVYPANSSHAEAVKLAEMVKDILDADSHLSAVAAA